MEEKFKIKNKIEGFFLKGTSVGFLSPSVNQNEKKKKKKKKKKKSKTMDMPMRHSIQLVS